MSGAGDNLVEESELEIELGELSSKGNILLVEDDPVLRKILRGLLSMEGYDVYEAASRQDTFERLGDDPEIAVMIADLGLPPMEHSTQEGLAVIRGAADILHRLKIIVLTGQDEEQSALEAIREGAFDFLSKPAESEEILSAVNRAFLFHRKEQDMAEDGVARLHLSTKFSDGLKAVREEAEEKLVRQVLKETGFNVYKSAARLGVKRESVYYFMKKFGINRESD